VAGTRAQAGKHRHRGPFAAAARPCLPLTTSCLSLPIRLLQSGGYLLDDWSVAKAAKALQEVRG
jgi:hypothetical protein